MTTLRFLHLALLCTWLGLVLAETVIEFALPSTQAAVKAKLHFWIDASCEVPVVLGVLLTGTLLAMALPILTGLHWLKIGLGLFAIGDNLLCAVFVVLRHRQKDDPTALARYDRRVRQTWVGVPAGLAALLIGVFCFSGL